ncbi:MAG: HTH domain-containing protein [Fimbriimonadaceae bacterium]
MQLAPEQPERLTWREAVLTVLRDATDPMHYAEIAEEIAARKLRGDDLGATPANTVSTIITVSLRDEGANSPFVKIERGIYGLRERVQAASSSNADVSDAPTANAGIAPEATGLINAFGMFWDRTKVAWAVQPKILGQQQAGSNPVDFGEQRGVYLLHDAQGVVYVGRATDQGLGRRLYQHTNDRLGGRWSRFSWFGVYPVNDDGTLSPRSSLPDLPIDIVIVTMEAVLIEGLEPRQNRKRGDDFKAVEYLQKEDPSLEFERIKAVMRKLEENFKS